MKSKAPSLGYSMDEILTVASIIKKEGANSNEVSTIAAVIYNRLEAGMRLQMLIISISATMKTRIITMQIHIRSIRKT